jgi:hypothetical protein
MLKTSKVEPVPADVKLVHKASEEKAQEQDEI